MNKKSLIITIICLVLSVTAGILSHDLFIGGTALATALLNSYFASEGKRVTYILGLINCLVYCYVGFRNNLYGLFFFYLCVFAPLQIHGLISWNKNLNKDNNVLVRDFTFKNSVIIIVSCIIGSVIIGYLLTLIPNQQLAFMDSTSNIINLCGVILMNMRFKEAWWVWLFNNVVDMGIWSIILIRGGTGAIMMFLVSLGYLLINFYGIFKWSIEAKKNREEK